MADTRHNGRWHARAKAPDERATNPVSGQYFADEAIDKPAQALIREALQNARDARSSDSGPVRIVLSVHEDERSLSAKAAERWLGDLWPHLRSKDSGLRDVSARPARMRYLVIEDFGTTGLTGDITRIENPEDRNNKERFYAFLRTEGYTNKVIGNAGSWGVGKTVFPRSSDINTVFVLSVRADVPTRVLAGQCILCYHKCGDQTFAPDLMWGEQGVPHTPVLPATAGPEFDSFVNDFGISRTDQPGLSIAIPALNEDITAVALLEHALREYFLPILRGQLVVEVIGRGVRDGHVRLDDRTIGEHVSALGQAEAQSLQPLLDLAAWSRSQPARYESPTPGLGVPGWEDVLPEGDAKALATRFRNGERLAIRVHVNVRKNGVDPVPAHFDVLLQQAEHDRPCKPVFIRDGIVIPKVRDRGLRSTRVHAIVMCEGTALSEMLCAAEGPGHTHWSIETQSPRSKFKSMYGNTKSLINLVESAPRAITERLLASIHERDTTSFASDFPTPVDENERRQRRRKKRPKPGSATPEIDFPKPKPRAFVIESRKGGFVVRRAEPDAPRPGGLHLRVAYDRTRGNPFKHYHPADFKLNQSPIKISYTGLKEATRHENVLKVDVIEDEFRMEVSGFDPNRDLEVDVRAITAEGTLQSEPDESSEGDTE